jgi:hypothetical protein
MMKLTKTLAVAVLLVGSTMVVPTPHAQADDAALNGIVGKYQDALGLYQKAYDETTDPALRAQIQQEMNEVKTTINELNTPGSPVVDPYGGGTSGYQGGGSNSGYGGTSGNQNGGSGSGNSGQTGHYNGGASSAK